MPGGPQSARTPGRILVPLFSIMRGAFKIFSSEWWVALGRKESLDSTEAPGRFEKGSTTSSKWCR